MLAVHCTGIDIVAEREGIDLIPVNRSVLFFCLSLQGTRTGGGVENGKRIRIEQKRGRDSRRAAWRSGSVGPDVI